MKIVITTFFLVIGFFSFAQTNLSPQFNNTERTREAIFFIVDLEDNMDVQALNNYLSTFDGKIESVNIDLSTQMCVMDVKIFDDENLEQIIFQAGFKGLVKSELPPSGYKYIYNPDGTWKLKEI